MARGEATRPCMCRPVILVLVLISSGRRCGAERKRRDAGGPGEQERAARGGQVRAVPSMRALLQVADEQVRAALIAELTYLPAAGS